MNEKRKQQIKDALDEATHAVYDGDEVKAVIIMVQTEDGQLLKMHGEAVVLARLAVDGARNVCETVRERLGLSLSELGTEVLGVPPEVVAMTDRLMDRDERPTRKTNKFAPSLTDELTKVAKF